MPPYTEIDLLAWDMIARIPTGETKTTFYDDEGRACLSVPFACDEQTALSIARAYRLGMDRGRDVGRDEIRGDLRRVLGL